MKPRVSREVLKAVVHVTVKCGCCTQRLHICHGRKDDFVEINGVCATRAQWRKVLRGVLR